MCYLYEKEQNREIHPPRQGRNHAREGVLNSNQVEVRSLPGWGTMGGGQSCNLHPAGGTKTPGWD